MNVSDLKVPVAHIVFVCGTDAAYDPRWGIIPDLEAKQKKRISPQTVLQFGQIMSLLHPSQMADILLLAGRRTEGDLIRRWFMEDDYDLGGMLNLIPGAWGIDRIVKHLCRHETLDFQWIDPEAYVEGMQRFYGVDATGDDLSCYSRPLADQFGGGLLERLKQRLTEDA